MCEKLATIRDRGPREFTVLARGTRDARTRARMLKRAALITGLLAATAGTASAGGTYIGLGIGTAPAISEDTDRVDSDSRALKGILGMRWGQWSIEGTIGTNELVRLNQAGTVFNPHGDLYVLGANAKFNLPLGNNFEAFGKLGLNHLVVRADNEQFNQSGNGLLFGAGFEYKLNLGVGGGSIFVDYTINRASMVNESDKELGDFTTRTWMLGLTIGI